jgi:Heavy metal associated domain 2
MNLPPLEKLPLPINIQVLSSTPGRIRLRVSHKQRQPEVMAEIVSTLKAFFSEIDDVRMNVQTGSITVYYDGEIGSFDDILTTLQNLGIIVSNAPSEKSQAAESVTNALTYLNHQLEQATNGYIDLRFLFPLLLALLALRQWLSKGSPLKASPWYVLAWYAFDSFLTLNTTNEQPQQSSKVNQPAKTQSTARD